MDFETAHKRLAKLPNDLRRRIGYDLYGGIPQFYIIGVDGTLAQLGDNLARSAAALRRTVAAADKAHAKITHERTDRHGRRQ